MEYDILAGTHIEKAIDDMLARARQNGEIVRAVFNGVPITIAEDTDAIEVLRDYHEALEDNARQYRQSPEGIAQEARSEERRKMMQEQADVLMGDLPAILKYEDNEGQERTSTLLRWLRDIGPATDHIGVRVNTQEIVRQIVAAAYGDYEVNCNVGDERVGHPDWWRLTAFYLIGQCLSMLEKEPYAIHGMIWGSWIPRFLRGEDIRVPER